MTKKAKKEVNKVLKMEHCFMTKGTEFVKEVTVLGHKFRIRNLSRSELDVMKEAEVERDVIKGQLVTYPVGLYTGEIVMVLISLGGEYNGIDYKKENEGWEFKEPVTFESIDNLHPKLFEALSKEVIQMRLDWINNEEIYLKN